MPHAHGPFNIPLPDHLAADVIGAAINEPIDLDAAATRAQLNIGLQF